MPTSLGISPYRLVVRKLLFRVSSLASPKTGTSESTGDGGRDSDGGDVPPLGNVGRYNDGCNVPPPGNGSVGSAHAMGTFVNNGCEFLHNLLYIFYAKL